MRAKQASFTCVLKEKVRTNLRKRLKSTRTPVSSTSKVRGIPNQPRTTGQDPFAFDDETEESAETQVHCTRGEKGKNHLE